MIAAFRGISGSAVVGDFVQMGGRVGVALGRTREGLILCQSLDWIRETK